MGIGKKTKEIATKKAFLLNVVGGIYVEIGNERLSTTIPSIALLALDGQLLNYAPAKRSVQILQTSWVYYVQFFEIFGKRVCLSQSKYRSTKEILFLEIYW